MPIRGRPFQPGHAKVGGRRRGTPNNATHQIRSIARGLLEDPAYQRALRQRLIAGSAQRIEQLLYVYAYGSPDPRHVTRDDTPVDIQLNIDPPLALRTTAQPINATSCHSSLNQGRLLSSDPHIQ